MILGVVLAGGQSTRFGSDKALAELGGRTLLARAVDALSGWCDFVIVAGRPLAPAPTIPDWPGPDAGPLGGLAAALNYAIDENYETVLSCGVDTLGLPENLLDLLSPAPAYVEQQPVVGHWPAKAAGGLEELMFTTELLVSELVTNAIRHAEAPIQLRMILDTALSLIDEGGPAAASIRGIAARVGVAPNAVYTYFPDKAAVVDAIVDRLLGQVDHEVFADRGEPWRLRVESLALELRQRLSAHPGAVPLMLHGPMNGPHALALKERLLELLAGSGLGLLVSIPVLLITNYTVYRDLFLDTQPTEQTAT